MLTGAHLHLIINHAPIFGSLFALAFLLVSFFIAPDIFRRTALVFLIFTGLAATAAKFTGEAAAHDIRGLPGVRREVTHAHEEAGDRAFIAAAIVGLLAAGALARFRRQPVPRNVTVATTIGTAVVAGLMVYAALLGGQVRHTELRPGATPADAAVIEPRREPSPE
jgi:uncharacterized membrane protein